AKSSGRYESPGKEVLGQAFALLQPVASLSALMVAIGIAATFLVPIELPDALIAGELVAFLLPVVLRGGLYFDLHREDSTVDSTVNIHNKLPRLPAREIDKHRSRPCRQRRGCNVTEVAPAPATRPGPPAVRLADGCAPVARYLPSDWDEL